MKKADDVPQDQPADVPKEELKSDVDLKNTQEAEDELDKESETQDDGEVDADGKPLAHNFLRTAKPRHKARVNVSEDSVQGQSKVLMSNGQYMKVDSKSGRTYKERAALPKFMLLGGPSKRDKDGFSWAYYRWNLDNPGLRAHPAKAHKSKDAQFVITCCLDDTTKGHFANLPKRTPESPYLVKILDAGHGIKELINKRDDMYALDYDLRDGIDKAAEPVRGVTIAPHNYYNGRKRGIDEPRKYFLAFQGRKTSKLRHVLHDSFNGPTSKYRHWKNISVDTIMDRMWNYKQQTGDSRFNDKMNTVYALLPKGDDRWSLRFSEAIGAGAIPVVMADGVTLPYENIIDWSKACIKLPNAYAEDADKVMKALPNDEATIMKMRKEVYEINRKFFATPEARADAMLLDAAAMVAKKGKYEPLEGQSASEKELSQAALETTFGASS